jgi:cell division protein FtsQ
MKINRNIVRVGGTVLAIVAVIVVLGFVERTVDRTTVQAIDVEVRGREGVHFIDEGSVRREVLDLGVDVMGATLGSLDLPAIEERLRSIPAVADAEVYHTMDGTLHVRVTQRDPVVRVINSNGTSFYIDRDGWAMPTSLRHTARVLVVTGDLDEVGAENGVQRVIGNDSLERHILSDDILRMALFIRDDPFWDAMIDHVVVDRTTGFELVPKVGGQRVLIGMGPGLEQRFNKLRLFYTKGMPRTDWRRYKRIDLRFADQIVCTQRTIP